MFLLTDTMSSRKDIFENCIALNMNSKLVVETRLAATQGRVYAFDPGDTLWTEEWQNTLYSDENAERSECGTTIVMGVSSSLIADVAVWQFIKWFNKSTGKSDVAPEFELLICMSPYFNILAPHTKRETKTVVISGEQPN